MANEVTKTKTSTSLSYPPRYNVIILNDDYTPMEFVIKLLVDIFNKDVTTAKEITMHIHNNGSAIAGTYNYEIAEQKTAEAVSTARANSHPLQIKFMQVE